MLDWLFKNVHIIDGTGKKAWTGDVGVQGEKIVQVAPSITEKSKHIIDGNGKVLAPGFMDIHRHADAAAFRENFGEAELRQGLTTIVNGNCGLSIAPAPKEKRTEMMDYMQPVTGMLPAEVPAATFKEYMAQLDQKKLPLNFGMLIGNGTLRMAVNDFKDNLSKDDIRPIQAFLQEALDAGVFGISTGFSYLPDVNYDVAELAEVLAPLKNQDFPFTTHVRGEGDILYESVEEVIELTKRLNIPLHVSHFKCIGKKNWRHLTQKTIDLIEKNRREGMDITCDVYTWTAGSTQMVCLLPPQYLTEGPEKTAELLHDPAIRAEMKKILAKPAANFENILLGVGFENVYIGSVDLPKNQELIGKNLAELAELRKADPYDALFDLLAEEKCRVSMIDYITCEDDIEKILNLPYSSIISDTVYPGKGLPHPRGYANIPHVIKDYVLDRGVLTLEQAIQKMTSLPAQALRMDKGVLKPGADADLVLFAPEAVDSKADYMHPTKLATGFSMVMVNGQPAVIDDELTGVNAGKVLRRK